MSAPLPPPHERPWRHPTELPPPPHDPPSRAARALIVSTAAVSLLLVGILAVRMTPDRAGGPREVLVVASVPTLTTDQPADATVPAIFAEAGAVLTPTELAEAMRRLRSRVTSSRAATDPASLPADSSTAQPAVMVTPVGMDGLGVTTEAALAGRTGIIDAVLPSGEVVECEVVASEGGVAVVAVRSALPADAATFDLGDLLPPAVDDWGTDGTSDVASRGTDDATDDFTVLAFGEQFAVDGFDWTELSVPEASPVIDRHGTLVGLTTMSPDGTVGLMTLDRLPQAASRPADDPATTAPQPSAPATTEPATEPPETPPVSTPATVEQTSTVPSTSPPDSTATNTSTEPTTTAR